MKCKYIYSFEVISENQSDADDEFNKACIRGSILSKVIRLNQEEKT